MKVLIIKTSSLGDVIHTLPAISDAVQAIPGIQFDWVVEEAFKEIPRLHLSVNKVIPVSIRLWRQNIVNYRADIKACIKDIRQQQYDGVIDAQGLIKSALLTRLARGKRYGLSKSSCREPLAVLTYQHKIDIPKGQHAITRVRQLFAKSLNYKFEQNELSYGLQKKDFLPVLKQPYMVFLHGTTWASKHWPETYWAELVQLADEAGFDVYLPWGNKVEKARAERLAEVSEKAYVLDKSTIKQLATLVMHASGVVGVDSGLAHLAAACGTAGVTIYGSTSAQLTATLGKKNKILQTQFDCSPCLKKVCVYSGKSSVTPACYEQLNAQTVWQVLKQQMDF